MGYYDKITRLLHWGFALLIPLQLLSEELMKRPKPGRIRDESQIFFFEMHEWIGMCLLVLIIARLAWGFVGAEGGWSRLFPYFSAQGRSGLADEVSHEIPGWFKGKLPTPGQEDYIAGAVHGLGLLLVFAMGTTGAIMLYGMEESGKMLGFVHDMKEIHEILGELLWIYIFAHAAVTILHMVLGHSMMARIFSFKK
ncbi:MAG: cytochrome b/b6 domain-containing protein [Mariprofundaceae bacterium]|nr:cytochrome b/b6 domain-containing protein [Mariprofundaceae bacterium]